jgi:flagellar hook-associated protein 3 FlgL
MAGIIPIPSSRVSGMLLRQRLVQQYQTDQLALFRLQEQISTGQRISLPSEDAPAALRAIALQRLIERKTQLSTNVRIGNEYLSATESALQDVATKLSDIKGSVLGVAGTISSDTERQSAIAEINNYLENLVTLANRQYQGRYLFAGSKTATTPYSFDGDNVVYNGDEASVRNYSQIGVLFASNLTGQDVFGGSSAEVLGTVDLNPQLSRDTNLSSLRGGRGLSANGALTISDGTNISIVDLSGARTIGDVVRLIEESPPAGREIEVTVTGRGLELQLLDPTSTLGGNLTVTEVANGTTARELGILEKTGVGTSPLVGEDLDPVLLPTTRLQDLLGSKARTLLRSGSSTDNNNVLLEATANGTAFNGVTVQYVDDELLRASPGLSAGSETVQYDASARVASAALTFSGGGNDLILTATTAGADYNGVVINITSGGAIGDAASVTYDSINKRLDIAVDSTGATTVQTVINAIAAEGTFSAAHDSSLEAALVPTATIAASDIGNLQGNTGNSGGDARTLYIYIDAGSTTSSQVVDAVNAEGTFTASLDPNDTTSAVEAGTGTVSLTATADLTSGGSGQTLDLTSGLRIVNGGQIHVVTFENAETVEDLLNTLNASEIGVLAELNEDATGINIRSRLSGHDFQIGENGGTTATQLGVRTYGTETRLSEFNYGVGIAAQEGFQLSAITGTDFTITTRDGQTFDINLTGEETLAGVVTAINTVTGANVTAQLAPPGNVLRLVDNTVPGTTDFSVSAATGSLVAQYLGLVPDGETSLSTASGTITGDDSRYTDFTITASDGQTFGIDLSSAETVGDVIDAINAITTINITARLSLTGNGIELVDNTAGAGQLTVSRNGLSETAELLGFVPAGEESATSSTGRLVSTDQNFLENESVFNTLIRLRDALSAGDLNAVERALEDINTDIDRVTFARAEIGATQQGLELSQQTLEDEDVQLRSALSDEIDVDLVQAISDMVARQTALQASLQVTANILQYTLLDYL